METEIIKVLIGSRAHGLANENSDYDYRGVFALPTQQLLTVNGDKPKTRWVEGKKDDTSWEISHFLRMAVKCNPTILEVFLAPVETETPWSKKLQDLFPHVWNSNDVKNAFIGYGMNQRKKFLEEKDNKPNKFAAAYLRSLVCGYELLTTGTFTIRIADKAVGEIIKRFKEGDYTFGEVINECRTWEKLVERAYEMNPNKETNMEAVNEFLLDVRKTLW